MRKRRSKYNCQPQVVALEKIILRGSGCYLKPKVSTGCGNRQPACQGELVFIYLLTKMKKQDSINTQVKYTNKQSNYHSDYLTTKAIYDLTCKSCWPKKVSFSIPLHKAKVAYLDIHAYMKYRVVTTCFPFTLIFFLYYLIYLFICSTQQFLWFLNRIIFCI
jgi:hypothetical protein